MADTPDPDKLQNEILEALRKMMPKDFTARAPEAEKEASDTEEKKKRKRKETLRFDLKPKEVKKHLDRFVIQQEEAKRVLATTVCDHYNHVRTCEESGICKHYVKQNVIMLGPTGVGKTYLIRCLADLVGVPFVKGDATKFSETGYVGGDVEDLVRELVQKADGDIELAQYGMIYLDEVDKIASAASVIARDVSGAGVQRGLLKIMEETEVNLRNPQDIQSQFQAVMEFQSKGKVTKPVVNTRHILFIVSGAFEGLPPIIERRMKAAHIGFNTRPSEKVAASNFMRKSRTEDFVKFGLEPEFIGRLPVRAVCDPLSEEDLYAILKSSEESILKQYTASFAAYGIKMTFEDKALWEIAKLAAREGTGARGLVTVAERIFRDLKYELPSSHVKAFTLTRDMALDPNRALDVLLSEEQKHRREEIRGEVRAFEQSFLEKNAIRIEFDAPALDLLAAKILADEMPDTAAYLGRLLSNYNYGLGLIQKKKPREKFTLGRDVIESPNATLDRWIKESYDG